MKALLNGLDTGDWPFSRGFQYGDGVFRTALVHESKVLDLDAQLERLLADARRLGLRVDDPGALRGECESLARPHAAAVLKVVLMRTGAERGYRSNAGGADRVLTLQGAPRFPATYWEEGIRAFRCSLALAAQPRLAGIKHLNRLEQVLASRDWQDGAQEGLLADDQDRPVGGTRTNLFWMRRDVLRTPALDRCGVAGMMRDKVLRLAAQLGIACEIGAGSWGELEAAEEAFVTNSVVGLWPLRELGGRQWRGPGPVARQLSGVLRHPRLVER